MGAKKAAHQPVTVANAWSTQLVSMSWMPMTSTVVGVAWRDPTKCRHCETDLSANRTPGTVFCSDACETATKVTGKLEGPQAEAWTMDGTASTLEFIIGRFASTWSST